MPLMYPSRRFLLNVIAVLLVLAAVIVGTRLPAPKQLLENISPQSASLARVTALLTATSTPFVPEPAVKNTGCMVNGALQDQACTPGAIFAAATPAQICVPGYTKVVRAVSSKLKKQIYAAYGLVYPPPTGTYELDHLIPLALGGSNDAANLFPEARDPAPGFKEKDVVEVYLYEQMCAGHISLAAAQSQIAKNWLAIYQALDSGDITSLKAKYPSWSN